MKNEVNLWKFCTKIYKSNSCQINNIHRMKASDEFFKPIKSKMHSHCIENK